MKILIVEDGKDKRHSIRKAIQEIGDEEIETAKTYFSARKKILSTKKYDLVILDMFLPDAKDDNKLNGLAGKDLVFDVMDEGINVPILVVTQYTEYTNNSANNKREYGSIPDALENRTYGKPINDDKKGSYDCTYYEGLHQYLSSEVPMYLGIVFYSNYINTWKNSLTYFVKKVQEEL